jgi:hypothetical protein
VIRVDNTPPWGYYIDVSLLATIFAQGHTAVTSIHLGRLAISSLHHPNLAPKTWAELFWAADQNWQGPIGIAQTLWGVFRLRRRISFPFLLFAVTSMVAMSTPAALDRAYPRNSIGALNVNITRQAQVLSRQTMDAVIIEPQLSIGAAGWIYDPRPDQIPENLYASGSSPLCFITDAPRPFADDGVLKTRLPGLQVETHCTEMRAEPYFGYQEPPSSPNKMRAWCSEHGLHGRFDKRTLDISSNDTISMTWCTGFNATSEKYWMNHPEGHTTTVIAWINTGAIHNSYLNCTSRTQTGSATVWRDGLYLGFLDLEFMSLVDEDKALAQTPFFPPVYAAFTALSERFGSTERGSALTRMLGYQYRMLQHGAREDTVMVYQSPTLLDMADHIEHGVRHMAAAIQVAGAHSFTYVPMLIYNTKAIPFTRSGPWIITTGALMGTWLVLLALGTVRMYRPTFGRSLNSYTAARLLVDMPHLVDGYCAGEAIDNPKLRTSFERVGDDCPDDDVGHITSGGAARLVTKRTYGAMNHLPSRCV